MRAHASETATAALVRAPSPALADGQVTFLDRRAVDVEVARTQHAGYVRTLRSAGVEIVEAPPAPEHPDAVFVEDAVVAVDTLAVITRSGASSRRGEGAGLVPLLQRRGFEVVELTAPATLDGGDVLQVDDVLYVGRSTRTNAAGIDRLRALVASRGRGVVAVEVDAALHLKTALTALPDGGLIARAEGFDRSAFADHHLVVAAEPSGANVLRLGDTVVIAASAPRTAELLRQRGHDVRVVEIGELEKLEAGPTCLCVLLPSDGPGSGTT